MSAFRPAPFLRLLLLAVLAVLLPAAAMAAPPQRTVDQAAGVLDRFRRLRNSDPERGIPSRVMRDAKGLAIITV